MQKGVFIFMMVNQSTSELNGHIVHQLNTRTAAS